MLVDSNDPRTVAIMTQIQHCNNTELRELLNEDARLEAMIHGSLTLKQQESEKDVVLASNKSLAEYNLSWEPKVNAGRQRLIDLYHTASQLERTIEDKQKMLEEQCDSVTMDTAVVLLESAATRTEEESENIAEKFLEKALDVETFLEEFENIRKTAHLRKVKADKMKELIAKHKQNHLASSTPSRPAPLPPGSSSTSPLPPYPATSTNNLPYPLFPPAQPSSLPYPLYPTSSFLPPQY